jgi:putative acetyltransferase
MNNVVIKVATTATDFSEGKRMFLEYAEMLGFSLCFQGFDRELETLHIMYAPPTGQLFLVENNEETLGCGGIRRYDDQAAELKRMYLRPELRGLGLGQQLLDTAMTAAANLGYHSLRLDTVPTMTAAIALYHKNGFINLDFHKAGDPEGLIYMERRF